VIVEKTEFEPLLPGLFGGLFVPPPPTVIGKPVAVTEIEVDVALGEAV
jgi:hypothetical protein